jgi:hypothetical protein
MLSATGEALPTLFSAKDLTKALPPRYRDWLKKDAVTKEALLQRRRKVKAESKAA